MKKIWRYSVRSYISIGLFFYFKRIEVYGLKNVPTDKPVLFLGNHQNALLDALLIATKCSRTPYFLTRASVFKKPFVSKILKSLQMLPVYRIRDGWNNLANNKAVFQACTNLFMNKEAVVIFPEGNHNLARSVRPLSKGFTRIVFDALEKQPALDIQLVPVGLNFRNATDFPDRAALYFGAPISSRSFITENRNQDVVRLKTRIKEELSSQTTNIPEDNYGSILNKLEGLQVNYLKPKEVNACIKSDFNNCVKRQKASNKLLKSFFKIVLIINVLFPYLFWRYMFKPKIKEPEFTSTLRFAVALTLVPIYLLIMIIILYVTTSLSIGIFYFIIVLLISLLAVKL